MNDAERVIEDLKDAQKDDAKNLADHKDEDRKNFVELKDMIVELKAEQKEMREQLQSILDIFKAMGYGKKFLLGLSVVIGAIIAILLGLKQIVHWLSN